MTSSARPHPILGSLFPSAPSAALDTDDASIDAIVGLWLAEAAELPAHPAAAAFDPRPYPEWTAKPGQWLAAPLADSGPRAFAVGLGAPPDPAAWGSPESATAEAIHAVRKAAATTAQQLHATDARRIGFQLDPRLGDLADADALQAALVDGLALGAFRFDALRGSSQADSPAKPDRPAGPWVVAADRAADLAASTAAVARGVQTARTLAALPPNLLNPATLAGLCQRIADDAGLTCTVHDADALADMGCGGILAVGRAGSAPPCLIQLEWNPPDAPADAPPALVVGKAVTFDSGGYNLKPTGGKGMKYDKCGGMAAIGIAEAVARAAHTQRVVALIPAAENLVAHSAYRPDDILTMHNGVTVEITNTDAEGRLILADALSYGTQTFQPRCVFDLATLTGGAVVALGDDTIAAFCNDPTLEAALAHASALTGERLWRLPLWPSHRAMLESTHADIVNSGERKASAIQGAAFLSHFVGNDAPKQLPTVPWVHLDIAPTATSSNAAPPFGKGPTGSGVRLVSRTLLDGGEPAAASTDMGS
ncbi:MAG: leucyl aminopeptidase family protein [Planctomycetota bacterium]